MTDTQDTKPLSLSAWKKAAHHVVTCPSGAQVGIRIPDLPALIEAGQIPQHLLDAALGVVSDENAKPTVELIKQQREFTDVLVSLTVVEPKVSPEDAADLPFEDKEFLVSVATRQRDLDAVGDHIGGLTKSEKFRRFRRVGEFTPSLEGA